MLIIIDFDCHRRPALIGLCFSGSLAEPILCLLPFLCHYLTWQINSLCLSTDDGTDAELMACLAGRDGPI